MATGTAHLTKTEIALEEVRNRIRTGAYEPGRRLGVEELTRELGMSPTPIREALRLLQADRLLDYRPHHGMVVAEVSPDRVEEISRLRSVLETMATEIAVLQLGAEQLAELERLHADFARRRNTRHQRARADADWHWALYEAAGSEFLADFIHRLWDAFPWRSAHVDEDHLELFVVEHAHVMEAVRAGDAQLAAERMHAHLESFNSLFLGALAPAD